MRYTHAANQTSASANTPRAKAPTPKNLPHLLRPCNLHLSRHNCGKKRRELESEKRREQLRPYPRQHEEPDGGCVLRAEPDAGKPVPIGFFRSSNSRYVRVSTTPISATEATPAAAEAVVCPATLSPREAAWRINAVYIYGVMHINAGGGI
jgi:hypothetical protein